MGRLCYLCTMRVVTSVIVLLMLWSLAALGEVKPHPERRVNGTQVWITLDPTFVTSDRIAGFILPEAASSLMVMEMPGEIDLKTFPILVGTTDVPGLKYLSTEESVVARKPGFIAVYALTAQGIEFRREVAMVASSGKALMLIINYQKVHKSRDAPRLRRAIETATWKPEQEEPPDTSKLPFTLDLGSKLVPLKVLGGALLVSLPGETFPTKPGAPVMVIAPSVDDFPNLSMEKLARQKALDPAFSLGAKVSAVRKHKLGGRVVFEAVASGKGKRTGKEIRISGFAQRDGGGYIAAIISCPAEGSDDLCRDLVRAALSVVPKHRPKNSVAPKH